MVDIDEQRLANLIEDRILPYSFKRTDAPVLLDGIEAVAIWKYKSLNMNRGIALVAQRQTGLLVGETARALKSPVGKAIGYIPFLYELGLQIIIFGRGVLSGGAGLHHFLDTVNTGKVVLQSIHLVDTDAKDLIQNHSPSAAGSNEDLGLPGWVDALEKLRGLTPGGMLMRAIGIDLPRMRSRVNYSVDTGRASVSVRTWGQTWTAPVIDAIEKGIDGFLASP